MKENVTIHQILLGSFGVFTYVVVCARTGQAALIDPAGEDDRFDRLLEEGRFQIRYILNTHGHADHVAANRRMQALFAAPICMHAEDDRLFGDPVNRQVSEGKPGLPPPGPADMVLHDRDVLQLGMVHIEVIHTPGHTPGSVCYLVDGNLFTGDTLFVGAVGRTDLTGGSLQTLLDSIEKRLIVLPGDTVIWPGHDYGDSPTSTIAREMAENPYITDFILG